MNKLGVMSLVSLLVSSSLGGVAQASDFDSTWDKDRFILRARMIDLSPKENSDVSIGGRVTASDRITPEIDITYFFTKNIAAELIAATTRHDMGARDTTLGDLNLGKVSILPPILTLQYHLNPEGQFRPYLGAGLNYTIFYNDKSGDVNDISYDNNFGYAFQAGFDYGLNKHWALNMDVKKLYLNTDVSINGGAVTADVDLDPWVIGVGVAYRF